VQRWGRSQSTKGWCRCERRTPTEKRIHNTNTKKVIHARFPLVNGVAAVDGDLEIPGVGGTGAPVRLEFLSPGGAATGKLLPTGNVRDTLDVPDVGKIEVSMIDAANPCVFVRARDVGLQGTEQPADVEARADVMAKFAGHPLRGIRGDGHHARCE
jgi:2-methylaconitate cis-trans-isomerase PrpF